MPDKATVKAEEKKERKNAIVRSPSYPAYGLEEALPKVKTLWDKEHKAGAPQDVILKHLGYSTPNGAALRALAALKKFGLTEEKGNRIYLTQLALDLAIYPPTDHRYQRAVRDAALKPSIYRKLYLKYRDGWPSDDTLKAELVRDEGFNQKQVSGFLRDFKRTLDFGGLNLKEGAGSLSVDDNVQEKFWIGDYVQWESQGVVQFKAKRVTGFSDDGAFAFVEGSNTGLPIDELSKVDAPNTESENGGAASKLTPPKRVLPRTGMNTEIFTLDEGEATLQWPAKMSLESHEDFEAWLQLIIKKAKRAADKKEAEER